jgi:hypothetical protein
VAVVELRPEDTAVVAIETNDMYLAINSLPSRNNSCGGRGVDAAGSLATTSSIYCPTAVEGV